MKLPDKEFKLLKKLEAKKDLTDKEKEVLEALRAKKAAPETKDAGNDPAWWKKVPSLIADSCNLKSNWIAGTQLADGDLPFIPCGVVKFTLQAVFGRNISATDPLNVWARDLYLRMFQRWRGISAYTASDLGITILAGVEIVRTIAKLERIYGVINRYSKRNVNMPFVEQEALGLTASEADWIRNHLSDFRYDLNVLIRKAQRLCIPKDMSIIDDSISLLGFEYLDHDNAKAQIIIFDTESFGVYEDTMLQSGGCMHYLPIGGSYPMIDTTGNSDNMFVALEYQLGQLLGSDGVQKIYGDLITWFGEDQLLHFDELVDEYIIAPVHSESILHKMHNMNVVDGTLYSAISNNLPAADITTLETNKEVTIYQVDDKIVTMCGFTTGTSSPIWTSIGSFEFLGYASNPYALTHTIGADILDTYRVDPNEDIIVEGALLKCRINSNFASSVYYATLEVASFWVVTVMSEFKLTTLGQVQRTLLPQHFATTASAQAAAGALCVLDWAPFTFVLVAGRKTEVYGDLDTPIPMYINTLKRIATSIEYSGLHTDIVVRPGSGNH